MTLSDEFFLGTKLYYKKLVELCVPLAKHLGVTHLIYVNIDRNGRLFCVCTHPEWVERFLEEQYYKTDPLMVHPKNMHSGFSFDKTHKDQEFKDTLLYDAIIKFNWCHSFAYVEKTPINDGGYVGLDFGTTKDNDAIINRLVREGPIIKRFIRDLNKKIAHIIEKDLKESRMDFALLKGETFHNQNGLVFDEEYEYKIQSLKESGILATNCSIDHLMKVYLTTQETNCLRSYITTHSLKKVSKELNLAVTTVSSYLENIKNKFNCTSKNELFEKAEILESLGRI